MSSRTLSIARYGTALVVLAVIALGVFAAETLIARRDPDLLWRDPASGDDGLKFYRFHPQLGLFHKSDFSGDYQGVTYTSNSRGVRGAEHPYARTPGRVRLAVLGDSIVWGFGVSDGDTLVDYLERALPAAEVVNLGVAGYGTGQELMLLREEGLRYQPDLVVLIFTIANDVEDSYFPDSAAAYPANLFYLEDGELRVDSFEITALQRLALWLNHNSYLVSWVFKSGSPSDANRREGSERLPESAVASGNRDRLAAHAVDLERYSELRYLVPARPVDRRYYARRGGLLVPDALSHYKVELVKQLILAVAEASHTAGADFAVVLAPFRAQLDSEDAYAKNPLNLELIRFFAAHDLTALDLLPLFLERGLGARELYADAMHFSANGNRVVAELLAEKLALPGATAQE